MGAVGRPVDRINLSLSAIITRMAQEVMAMKVLVPVDKGPESQLALHGYESLSTC
jgi:hypothetical protein